jgi:hypothetical protein
MDIEIENRHPPGSVFCLRVAGRDRRSVEEAKSHRRGGPGMMARGTHRDKGILGAAAHDLINRRHNAAHAMRDGREAFRAHGRVGIEIDSSARGWSGLDCINIIRRVNKQRGRAIDAGGIHPAQHREARVIESPGDGAEAAGALRMTSSGIVIEASRVAQKECRHNRETRAIAGILRAHSAKAAPGC